MTTSPHTAQPSPPTSTPPARTPTSPSPTPTPTASPSSASAQTPAPTPTISITLRPAEFVPAPQPEMVRSLQKDEYVLSAFRDDVREATIQLIGSNHWSYDAEVDLFTSLCYHGCTTLRGRPTLGEEYVDIRQVTDAMRSPSFQHRSLLIALQCIVPYLYHKTRKHGRRWITTHGHPSLNTQPDADHSSLELIPEEEISSSSSSSSFSSSFSSLSGTTSFISRFLAWIKSCLSSVGSVVSSCVDTLITLFLKLDQYVGSYQKWHLAMFYLFGHYLQISKRMAGVRYVLVRRPDDNQIGYEMLGILLLTQLCITAIRSFMSYVKTHPPHQQQQQQQQPPQVHEQPSSSQVQLQPQIPSSIQDALFHFESQPRQQQPQPASPLISSSSGSDEASDGVASDVPVDESLLSTADTCTLCLSRLTDATVTECGHIFCWGCIAECCTNKPECPLCRQPCSLNQLILLAHYANT